MLGDVDWYNQRQKNLAKEFRHLSWYQIETTEILKEYNAFAIGQNKPATATPIVFTEGKTVYIRFYGIMEITKLITTMHF